VNMLRSCAVSVLLLTVASAQPLDISGVWVAKPNEDFEFVWELRVAGGKITGTQKSPMGDAPIVDGRIDGAKIEFIVEQEFFGDMQRQTVTGEIVGDELRISLPPPRQRGPGGPAGGPPPGGPPPGGPGPGPGPGPGGPGGPGGIFSRPLIARRGVPTPSYRAPSVNYGTLPKIELPALTALPANGLAKRPPMGWNSWNKFRTKIDDRTVREVADAMVATGMRDAGYVYINIDDGWQGSRDATGVLQPNPHFPDMKALAAYVHGKGLKLGIYSSPGPRTCGGFEGSYGHEEIDARTWAAWGIDYLKYDWCSASRIWQDESMQAVYQRMGEALRKTGRPIVYSLCQYGRAEVQQWGPSVGGNLWRTTFDIRDAWESMAGIGFSQSELAPAAKPGHWNDPDMLEIGNGGMSPDEYRTHFSLWALLAAPLIAGNDLRAMSDDTKAILLNREAIAINQDALGRAASRVKAEGDTEVWMRPLDGGAYAVGLFNRGASATDVRLAWTDLKLRGPLQVRDLWAHADRGRLAESFTANVPAHGVVMLRLSR
jgi:alpha-galactosidase